MGQGARGLVAFAGGAPGELIVSRDDRDSAMVDEDELRQRYLKKEERADKFRTKNLSALLVVVPIRLDLDLAGLRGEMIGEGTTRKTFAVRNDQKLVVKEAKPRATGAKWTEYLVWNAGRVTRWAPVLGAVHSISESGQYLVMERLSDLTEEDRFRAPDIPYWLNDLKKRILEKPLTARISLRPAIML